MPGIHVNGTECQERKHDASGGTADEAVLFLPPNWSEAIDVEIPPPTDDEDNKVIGSVVKESSKSQFKTRLRQNIWRTLSNGFAVFVLGVMISMKGPTFIDIQNISDTDVEGGSLYVTASAFGYMTGSFIAGGLYDRMKFRNLLMFVALLLAAASFAVTPLCSNFVLMLLVSALVSIFCALFETTANAEEVHSWEGKSGSAMQFLSFNYSLGGIVGPLIAEPFLAPVCNRTKYNAACNPEAKAVAQLSGLPCNLTHVAMDAVTNSSPSRYILSNSTSYLNHMSKFSNVSVNNLTSQNGDYESFTEHGESRVLYAYIISALLTVASAIPFLVLFIINLKKHQTKSHRAVAAHNRMDSNNLPLNVYTFLAGLISAFYFFYTSVDDSFAQYLSVFVVTQLGWTKEKGAEISALYWGSSTVTKLGMVFLVHQVRLSFVLLLSTIGMIVSLAMFSIFSYYNTAPMVWISTALLALSQSAVFGGGFTWADSELIKFDGKITSSVMIFCSLGAMATPLLLGFMMKQLSPMTLTYLLTGQATFTFVLFFLMLFVVKPIVWKKYGPPRPEMSIETVPRVETKTTIRAKETSEDPDLVAAVKSSHVTHGEQLHKQATLEV